MGVTYCHYDFSCPFNDFSPPTEQFQPRHETHGFFPVQFGKILLQTELSVQETITEGYARATAELNLRI